MKTVFLLMTRFNIYVKNWKDNDVYGEENTPAESGEEYLSQRFEIFEKYTLPSVDAQHYKDFKWVVLFSDRTPDIYRKKISDISENRPYIIPVFLSRDETWPKENLKKTIGSLMTEKFGVEKGDRVITLRVDNDDVIANDYLENIYATVEKETADLPYAVFFENGLQLDLKSHMIFKKLYEKPAFNHFFSDVMYFDADDYISPLNLDHTEVGKTMRTVSIYDTDPMWMEIIHETNVLNHINGYLESFVFNYRSLKRFEFAGKYRYACRLKALVYLLSYNVKIRLKKRLYKEKL